MLSLFFSKNNINYFFGLNIVLFAIDHKAIYQNNLAKTTKNQLSLRC